MNVSFLHSNYDLNCRKNDAKLHKIINYVQLFKNSMSCFLLFQRVKTI